MNVEQGKCRWRGVLPTSPPCFPARSVPTKLPYAPGFWTQTDLCKWYVNPSNFPHLLKIVESGQISAQGSDPMPSRAPGRERKRLRMESKVTIGEGKAVFPPRGAEAAWRAEGTCRGQFLSSFPVPPSRPHPQLTARPCSYSASLSAASCSECPSVDLRESLRFPPSLSSKGRAEWRRPFRCSPSDW